MSSAHAANSSGSSFNSRPFCTPLVGDNALGVLIGGSSFKLPRLDFPPHHRARAGAQYSQLGSIVISESALIATLIAAAVLLTL